MRLRIALFLFALLIIGLGVAGTLTWSTPQPVAATGVQSIVSGGEHSCAVLTGDELKCWGRNARGQLGDDGDCGRECDEPVAVDGMGSGVSVVGAGGQVTCAGHRTDGCSAGAITISASWASGRGARRSSARSRSRSAPTPAARLRWRA